MKNYGWSDVRRALTRPYRVTASMLVLVGLVPLYLVIASQARSVHAYRPHLPLDDVFPVVPAWSLVYGSLYLFLILLPILVMQEERLIRAAFRAYLVVWLISYAIFLLLPTEAPRPDHVEGDGFAAWGLRFLYHADPPYNCFPSLHVAHSFVSAYACHCVHRRVGKAAFACATLVGLSTLFTKQHYVVDVFGGVALALLIAAPFLRAFRPEAMPELQRRVAPGLALCAGVVVALGVAAFWGAYQLGFELTSKPAF